ncbi:MAG: BON domain-containing protein [Candidatus Aureabacteria bacterium]|nr:BON domain-containing protein [Candidatus Auribacterota bacterium]
MKYIIFLLVLMFTFSSAYCADKSRAKREKEASLQEKTATGTNFGSSKINVISNKDIQDKVTDALKKADIVPVEELSILVKDSIVSVSGNVDSLEQKDKIQQTIMSVPGVRGYKSNLKIKK